MDHTRYFIGFSVPTPISLLVSKAYQEATRTPLPIKLLHLTLIPPFFLHSKEDHANLQPTLTSTSRPIETFSFQNPSLFPKDTGGILYLPVTPVEPLKNLYEQILLRIRPYLEFDLSIYPDHQLPDFLPHVSLDYHYPESPPSLPNFPSFSLPQPDLFEQSPEGSWFQSTPNH